jgi:hypothetical protein
MPKCCLEKPTFGLLLWKDAPLAFDNLLKDVQGDVLQAIEGGKGGKAYVRSISHCLPRTVKVDGVGHPAYFGVGALRLLQNLVDARPRLFALLKLVQNLLRLLALRSKRNKRNAQK